MTFDQRTIEDGDDDAATARAVGESSRAEAEIDASPTASKTGTAGSTSPAVSSLGPGGDDLKRRALAGSVWTFGGFAAVNLIRFVSNVLVTKLVAPDLYGVMTLAMTFMVAVRMFSDVGIGPSVVRHEKGETEPFLRTAFTMQVLRGFIMWLATCAIAWPIAKFYGNAEGLLWVLPVAGIGAIIEGFRSTAYYRLARRLRLKEQACLEVCRQLLIACGMIAWARVSPTLWALVIPSLVVGVLETIVTHFLMRDRRDRFGWDRESARALTGLGRWIFLSTALTFCANQLDRLVFGRMYPIEMLGVYGVAVLLAGAPRDAILKIGSSVVFPTYAALQRDPERFRRVFPKMRRMLLAMGGFAVTGLICCGVPLVTLLYTGSYRQAGWMVQLIGIAAWFQLLEATNASALLAAGKGRWMAAITGSKVLGLIIFLPLGHYLGGFPGSLIGLACADALRYLVSVSGVSRLKIGVSIAPMDLLMSLAVAGSSLGILLLVDYLDLVGWRSLVLSMALVGVIWIPACLLLYRRSQK